jgi:TIR domain
MSRVFINYRRADSSAHANLLYDWVRERYGAERVFKDVDSIEPGLDFEEAIEKAVESSKVMLVVVGNEWIVDTQGRRRLDDADDYVRMEIATALRRNIRVIPVLVEGATMPTAADLPEPLAGLVRRHAFELSDARSSADRLTLLRRLDLILEPPETARNDGDGMVSAPQPFVATPAPAPSPSPQAIAAQAPVVAAPVAESAPPGSRTKQLVKWGWILVAGAILIPFAAVVAAVFGALVISRGEGKKTGMGIAIIVSAILVGLFSASYWLSAGSA